MTVAIPYMINPDQGRSLCPQARPQGLIVVLSKLERQIGILLRWLGSYMLGMGVSTRA